MFSVYVKTTRNGYISAVNSSAFLDDVAGWVEVARGYGDRFHHAQNNYLGESLVEPNGEFRYKLVGGAVVRCTEEDLEAQRSELVAPLSLEERITHLEKAMPAPQDYVAGKWYYRGDKITFDGVAYTCIAPDRVVCVWNPLEYPSYWMK